MARKKIGKILSGGGIILCVVLFCTLDNDVHAFVGVEVTYTISGSTGVSGVTMNGLPGQPVTDNNGFYSATVKYGWSGTVTPVLEGYNFEPRNKTYQSVTGDMGNEDYMPTPITFTISGKAEMEGVEMSGLPGNPLTGSDGTYSVTVEYGWKGTVTPIKEGYTFTPANRGYPPVKTNQANHNYVPEKLTLLVTGSVGLEGVVMQGLPGNPISRQDGIYSVKVDYGWSGAVTPKKEGYEFDPADRQYSNVVQTESNQNYTAALLTYTISGTAGMEGVQLKGLPGNPFTDENGYYSINVNYGFNSTVTPEKEGYRFEPASMIYSQVNSDRTNQDFRPSVITLTISGTTNMEGVEMSGLPGNPVTGKDGSYKVSVDYGWSGTVAPIKEGYQFTPDSKPYPAVNRDQTNQNYTTAIMTFTISGSVGIDGVVIKGLTGKAVMSDATGNYTATVDYGWSGTITPTKGGYEFEPVSMQYNNVMASETNQSYTPTLMKYKVSGKIISDKGQPVANVSLLADNNGGTAMTDSDGNYELFIDHGWRGKITPTIEGYTFTPTNKPYSVVTREQTNQNFNAIVRKFTISGAVIINNTPIEGVLISANNGGSSDTTDAKGQYSVEVPYGWSGEVTPTKKGFNFNPPSQSFTNVTYDIKDGQQVLPKQPVTAIPPVTTIPPGPTPPVTMIPPGPTPPVMIPPGPTPPGPTPPVTTPPAEEPPKTGMEGDIARIQDQLQKLLDQAAGGEVVPTVTAEGLPGAPGEPLITYTFIDSDLVMDVLPTLASQGNIHIIPDETVAGLITADFKNVPLGRALEIVLAGTPYVVKKTPFYYLVCSGGITDTMFPIVSETRRIRMNYITAEAAVGLLSSAFSRYVQAEPGAPGTDTYTVVVTAPPALTNRIVSDLKQIDRVPPHVLLDARIVVMERGDLLNLGVEWSFPTVQMGTYGQDHYGKGTDAYPDYGGEWPWGVKIGYSPDGVFTNALELALNLLTQNGEATVLAKPQVLAQDGKQAQMQVLTEEYYMLTSPETAGYYYTRSELQQIESGTTLTITPHIGDNNDITLQISVEVSDSIPRGRGSDLPVVTRRKAENVVRIKDGGTVALAGLTENRTRKDTKRVPGLSNLPLLGSLFKNTNNDNYNREIAVFVTARIIPEIEQAAGFPESSSVIQAPAQPAGEDFRKSLQESLSRQMR